MLTTREILRIKRIRSEYRVSVRSRFINEWRDIACARVLFELLLRLQAHEAEYSSVAGYYNPKGPRSFVKMALSNRRFSVIFGISTKAYIINSFFSNLYWGFNFHFSQLKNESSHEVNKLERDNMVRLELGSDLFTLPEAVSDISAESTADDGLLKSFAHSRDFKLMSLVNVNEGKEKERTSILTLKFPNSNRTVALHCFYFSFLPYSLTVRGDFKRHFGIDFEFSISKFEESDPMVLYNIIIFLTATKLNWIWVEEEIIDRFEKINK